VIAGKSYGERKIGIGQEKRRSRRGEEEILSMETIPASEGLMNRRVAGPRPEGKKKKGIKKSGGQEEVVGLGSIRLWELMFRVRCEKVAGEKAVRRGGEIKGGNFDLQKQGQGIGARKKRRGRGAGKKR